MIPSNNLLSRRAMVRLAGLSLGALASPFSARAAEGTAPLNRFPRTMQDWLTAQVRHAESLCKQKRERALSSKKAAETDVEIIREAILLSLGPFPEKTPLNPRITGTLDRPDYRIEKVIFESRPQFLVTANLYLPKNQTFPRPAVVVACGHSENSKCAEAENAIAQGFARLGYVVLIFDPPGQGERYLYPTAEDVTKSRHSHATYEHAQAGNQMVLVGESSSSWWAWDGIRALDYLLTRPEVDPKHVGITGNSGGGMQTAYLCAVEPRFTMAAPSCWVTTIRRNAENELTQDTEQCPRRILSLAMDHSDLLAAFAPKPLIIQAQEKDFFDIRGTEETYKRLKALYTVLGKPENIQLQVGPYGHSYPKENREATYRFFNTAAGLPAPPPEAPYTPEKDADLWCTPKGSVMAEAGSRSIFSFTQERSEQLADKRAFYLDEWVIGVLKLPGRTDVPVPEFAILRGAGRDRYPGTKYVTYAVETEWNIEVLVTRLQEGTLSRPERGATRAVLYLSHRSADAELREEPFVAGLRKDADAAFYVCDVRGIGESRPNPIGVFPFDAEYFYSIYGIMLDRPLLGQRVYDALRVLDWLQAQGHTEVHLAGKGWGALVAAFAGSLHPAVTQVSLKNALRSFAGVAETEDYKWPSSMLVPDILNYVDLPDIYETLTLEKGLTQSEPWGAMDGLS